MNESEIIKQIESGKYGDSYVIYNRRSTDDLENQKNSLEYQREENLKYARNKKLKIADLNLVGFCRDGVISEKHSAYEEDSEMLIDENGSITLSIVRPKFGQLLRYLNKKLFKGVIFLCYDRASRNKLDDAIIKKLTKTVDLRFAMADYDKSASGELHMDVDSMFASHYSRVTSEKIKLALAKNRGEGKCTYKAPVGYLNSGSMDHKPFDPIRAPIVKRMFELADDGWSTRDICKWAISQGFTTTPQRKKRSKAQMLAEEIDDKQDEREKVSYAPMFTTIQKILTNNFYIGLIKNNDGTFIKSISHEPLISEELFYSVQSKLSKKSKSVHYDKPLEFPYRNLFRCGDCERIYTPYPKKGNLYVNSKCKVGCPNTNKLLNKADIDEIMTPYIAKLYYKKEELETLEENANLDIKRIERNRIKELESVENKKKKHRADLEYLRAEKSSLLRTGVYTPESYMEEVKKLETEIETLIQQEVISEDTMRETIKDVFKVSELLKTLHSYWLFMNEYERDSILRIIFSELVISEKTLQYKLNSDFIWLNSRLNHLVPGAGLEPARL